MEVDGVESLLNLGQAAASLGVRPVPDTKPKPESSGVDSSAPEPQIAVTREAVDTAVDNVNQLIQHFRSNIRFEVFEGSGELMVQVIDRDTSDVIRTIPPESVLEAHDKFADIVGLIFDEER